MAASANSLVSNHSPRTHEADAAALNSPHAKQSAAVRGVPSPWMHDAIGSELKIVVDEGSSSPLSPAKASAGVSAPLLPADDLATDAQMDNADNGSGINNAGMKPVWNKPSNDTADAGTVMGAVSWPALSESARASPKSSSSDSLRVVTDGLISPSQATGIASPTNNTNVNLTTNHITFAPQRSIMRDGGGGISSNSGVSQPPRPALVSGAEMSRNSAVVEPSLSKESPHKESRQKGGLIAQSPGHSEHPPQRNSFRRGNGGSHPRGDSSFHHNNHWGRQNHSGNHDWNRQRSFNSRDMQMQSPRGIPRGFMRNPPPNNSAYVPHPPPPLHVPPFGGPLVYPELAPQLFYVPAPPPESLRGVHIGPPISPHAMFFLPDPLLHSKIVNQIDYYFSNENLVKDTFLRMNMDEQGWVPIKLIAGFKKVMMLTDNIQLIFDALLSSAKVEIQGEKVRRRNDWSKWIMRPSSVQIPNISSAQYGRSPGRGDMTGSMHNLVLDENS